MRNSPELPKLSRYERPIGSTPAFKAKLFAGLFSLFTGCASTIQQLDPGRDTTSMQAPLSFVDGLDPQANCFRTIGETRKKIGMVQGALERRDCTAAATGLAGVDHLIETIRAGEVCATLTAHQKTHAIFLDTADRALKASQLYQAKCLSDQAPRLNRFAWLQQSNLVNH